MTDKEYKYYFGCGFAWWAVHIFFRPFEAAEEHELHDLQDQLDIFEEHAENIAAWFLDEVAKPGLDFEIDKKEVSMFSCLTNSEPVVKSWMHQLINVMHAQKIEDKSKQYQYLYCLLIGWELYMIVLAQKFLNQQKPEGKMELQELVNPYANFLLNEWDLSCRKFFQMTAEEMMRNEQARKTYEEIAINWHQTIDDTIKKYLRSEQQ
ncbi:hypothetical protein [Pseudobacter ginsenosidimutans]|uniref:Uncharacterized protein n=1 Tax=Pseudobacter ginsenosidimutans TaxID=661488 RepID=A0A4Q7MUY8_9BACT|nr:hypothetical protein [Pseudobacter ginsenosidimutans]QEC41415.1 hypothetical protein FSB84_06800 [Pseudobacter ginsenosidimutans]RZS71804.1 hypothetical protein EV199_3717 [Pseudobacter ginsenosidimutans]